MLLQHYMLPHPQHAFSAVNFSAAAISTTDSSIRSFAILFDECCHQQGTGCGYKQQ
jgi:hypothetical protein